MNGSTKDANNRHDEPDPERSERLVHVVDRTSYRQNRSMGWMHPRHDVVYILADRRKVLRFRHRVDVEDPAELIVVDFGWSVD